MTGTQRLHNYPVENGKVQVPYDEFQMLADVFIEMQDVLSDMPSALGDFVGTKKSHIAYGFEYGHQSLTGIYDPDQKYDWGDEEDEWSEEDEDWGE